MAKGHALEGHVKPCVVLNDEQDEGDNDDGDEGEQAEDEEAESGRKKTKVSHNVYDKQRIYQSGINKSYRSI